MKVIVRLLNILTELDILNYILLAPQLFQVCTSLSSSQISQNGLQSLLMLTNPQSEDSIELLLDSPSWVMLLELGLAVSVKQQLSWKHLRNISLSACFLNSVSLVRPDRKYKS